MLYFLIDLTDYYNTGQGAFHRAFPRANNTTEAREEKHAYFWDD